MWFAERPLLQVALLEDHLVIDRPPARGAPDTTSLQVLNLAAPVAGAPIWQPAMDALAAWLREQGLQRAHLHVHLSAHFVRWQLLEWQPRLTQPQELDAYVQLRYRATFGAPADQWRVVHAEPQPGCALPTCAIDEALLTALNELQTIGRARVLHATPYFSAAFDRWRSRLDRQTAWFGAAEPGSLTLGLLHRGVWCGLRAARHHGQGDAGWRSVLPALQAQIGLASGLDLQPAPPLFLAGCGAAPGGRADPGLVWLQPEGGREPAHGIARMAWGV